MSRGRDKFKKFKPVINLLVKLYSLFPRKVQNYLLVKHRKTTGYIGMVVRYALLKNLAKSVGDNVSIQPDVYLFNVSNLIIGNNVSIHPMCYLEAYGGIEIGNDISLAHGVTIMSVTHDYQDSSKMIKDQGLTALPVVIEDNVWVGSKATVLGGNTIKSGSIIGAGSVVTKNVEPNVVMAGVPAKKIKER